MQKIPNPEITIALDALSIDATSPELYVQSQKTLVMQRHRVEKSYLILSKNDFGKVKKRINLGIFNKKTNFIIGEKKSLLVWDNELEEITKPDTSEIKNNPSRYFILYDMNFIFELNNKSIEILDKIEKKKRKIILNREFGYDIGNFLRIADPDNMELPSEFHVLKALIKIENGKISLNKQLLINSNYEFLLGILEGYIQTKKSCFIKKNINLYNFTYILNLLGAQYSIRNIPQSNEKQLRFRLPFLLRNATSLDMVFIRTHKYLFNTDGKLYLEKGLIAQNIKDLKPSFKNLVNTGLIELIPAKDLVFIELDESQVMYDFTMGLNNANNYAFKGTPFLSNSDGDILSLFAIMSKDAAQECQNKFGTENKERFLNLVDGSVSNWGVKLDSQLGLYGATK